MYKQQPSELSTRVKELTQLDAPGKDHVVPPKDNGARDFYIFYYWKSCPHCHEFSPQYDEMSLEGDGEAFYKIEDSYIPGILDVHSFPCVVLYSKDGKEVQREIGSHNKEEEMELFEDALESIHERLDNIHTSLEKLYKSLIVEITKQNVEFLFSSKSIPRDTLVCAWSHETKEYMAPLKVLEDQSGKITVVDMDNKTHIIDFDKHDKLYKI